MAVFVASTAGGTALGWLLGLGQDARFNFYNPNTGYWNYIDLGQCCSFTSTDGDTGTSSLDTDGYQVQGNYNSSSDTVTVTVVAN